MNLLLLISIFWVTTEVILSILLRSKDSQSDKNSLRIMWVTIGLSIVLGKVLGYSQFTISVAISQIIQTIGVIVIGFGLTIRWVAILKLRHAFTVNVSVSQDQFLVKTSIYKYIRHPAYLGSLTSFIGLGVAFNNWMTLVIIVVPIVSAFLYRIRIEENLLADVMGQEYLEYVSNSWRLLPWVY
jgi:protein-S-isoprenylcysteine O-methyltransferase Ste14